MLKKRLSYFLLLLVTLQSIASIADAHQYHEESSQHQELNIHNDHVQTFPSEEDKDNLDDCQHCCHCHSHCSGALAGQASIHIPPTKKVVSHYQNQRIIRPLGSPFRPPKA